jgi:hypothetical protein
MTDLRNRIISITYNREHMEPGSNTSPASMNISKVLLTYIFIFLVFPVADISAQRIENVHPAIESDQIYIYYDLLGIPTDQSVLITVFMSTDGGETYGEPLKSVTGDVGLVTGPGKERTIIWDVFSDLNELVSVDVKFKVKANLLDSDNNRMSVGKVFKLNLNTKMGYKSHIDYGTFGLDAKGSIYLNQLGLGLRADYFRTFRQDINYTEMSVVYPDTGFFWGYSAGPVIEYDFLKSNRSSLYPFLHIGQSKFIYEYNSDYRNEEYFKYSIFGSVGIGFDLQIYSFLYLGTELEYMISPWIDLVPSENPDESMDGFTIGFVIRFVINTE